MRRPVKAGGVRLAACEGLRRSGAGECGDASREVLIGRRRAVGLERVAPLLKRAAKVIEHSLLTAPGRRVGHLAIVAGDRAPRGEQRALDDLRGALEKWRDALES